MNIIAIFISWFVGLIIKLWCSFGIDSFLRLRGLHKVFVLFEIYVRVKKAVIRLGLVLLVVPFHESPNCQCFNHCFLVYVLL